MFTVNKRRIVIQQDTIYIDKDGKQVTTSEKNLSDIDTKEIVQIGFYENENGQIKAVRMPRTIEKVPDKLPPEITSINKMFWKCELFNQDLSKWNVSKVKKCEYFADWSPIANTNKLPNFGA